MSVKTLNDSTSIQYEEQQQILETERRMQRKITQLEEQIRIAENQRRQANVEQHTMQLKITQLEEQIRIAENHPRRSLSEESVVDVNQTGRKMSSAGFMPEGAQYPQQSIVDIYNEELHKLQRTAG